MSYPVKQLMFSKLEIQSANQTFLTTFSQVRSSSLHQIPVFEKKVLKMCGPKRKEMTGLYNQLLHNFHLSDIGGVIKNDDVGDVCNIYRSENKCPKNFVTKT